MSTLDNPWFTPNFSASSFAGDNRDSYDVNATRFRTEQTVNVDFDSKSVTYSSNIASGTTALDKAGKIIEKSKSQDAGPIPTYDKPALLNGNSTTIYLSIDAQNNLVPGAPEINYQFAVTITPSEDRKSFTYSVEGAADGFPAYELWITDKTNGGSYLLINSTPTESGDTPRALFPPMENKYKVEGSSANRKPKSEVKFKSTKNTPKL